MGQHTAGYTTTPSYGFFGEGVNTGDQVGGLFYMAALGYITSLAVYVATFTGSATPKLVLWQNGTVQASAPGASVGTSPQWQTVSFGTPVLVGSGAIIYLGFTTDTSHGFTCYFDQGGHGGLWNNAASPPVGLSGNSWSGQIGAYYVYWDPCAISSIPSSPIAPGQQFDIYGTSFTGALQSIDVNGTAVTTYTVVSDTHIQATLPSGATSGPVHVVTLDAGTGTSGTNLQVSQAYADNGSAFVGGVLVQADNGSAWVSGVTIWADDGTAWHQIG